jgi:hypothetical protein
MRDFSAALGSIFLKPRICRISGDGRGARLQMSATESACDIAANARPLQIEAHEIDRYRMREKERRLLLVQIARRTERQ